MTSRTTRLATAGLLAARCPGLVAACGDEDDDGGASSKNASACQADADVGEGFNKFFSETPALQSDGPPPKSATPQIAKNYDRFLAKPLAEFKKNAPNELAADTKGFLASTKKIRSGDFSAFMGRKTAAQEERIRGYLYNNCDDEKTEVEGPDYAFENIADTLSPGVRRFKFQNTGTEVHEMVLLAKKPGVTESFDQILKLPEAKSRSKVVSITTITDVDPGRFGYGTANLTPGEYIAVCFLPKGSQPGVEGKGKPHFQLGMKKEFNVE